MVPYPCLFAMLILRVYLDSFLTVIGGCIVGALKMSQLAFCDYVMRWVRLGSTRIGYCIGKEVM